MGINIKRDTVFLEFYGLPGSGKSTLSHLLATELRNQKNIVDEPTYDIDHNHKTYSRIILKLLCFFRFIFCCPIRSLRLTKCVIRNGYKGANIVSQCANIAHKLWVYDHAHSNYAILDEGITQSAISLSYMGIIDVIENEKILYSLCEKRVIIKIYIKISIDEAKIRLSKRNTHDSRVERINGIEQKKIKLKSIEALCDSISSDVIINGKDIKEDIMNILQCIE